MATPPEAHTQRGTICLETARILSQRSLPGNQFILRVAAPRGAVRATPGAFAHLSCDPLIPMRRPLSIMRADADGGWLEFLYKPIGVGLALLAKRAPGETISVLSPIGHGFALDSSRPMVLAIAGGVGIPPVYFLAERLRRDAAYALKVFMGSEVPFPFPLCARRTPLEGLPGAASMAVAELDAWSIPSALASNAALEGSFAGHVTELARLWLETQPAAEHERIQVVGCGPHAMLRAAADLARSFALPCQLAVEEFMACGVGGCAGCIVPLHRPEGIVMKRVCVDGPVFDARELYPA
ncbi:MAG TPA: dihydroorotate dehydrogenase electron transfer subunit [Gammaproteobacteria bacterium]|nr:dihydroorotate dehydrogenase electron transfer subunit [Gammaproteobacteria bacterium]